MTPDIVILDSQWPRRALLRAQLIEEGYEVVATDDWTTVKSYVQLLVKPRLVIVDLQGLPAAQEVLDDLHQMMKPGRVLVLTALGAPTSADIQRRGFQTMARPITVGDIVEKRPRSSADADQPAYRSNVTTRLTSHVEGRCASFGGTSPR